MRLSSGHLFLAVFSFALTSCRHAPAEHAWGVYFSGLPEKVLVKLAGEDAVFYILKQTHEPVLRKDDGQNYSSRILKSWRRNTDSTEYVLCPDTSQEFDGQNLFSLEYFISHLSRITGKYSREFRVERTGDCARVSFDRPRKGYSDFLTKYENAPTLAKNINTEIGLGYFYVEDLSKERVLLKRKQPYKNGYNSVIMYEYSGLSGLKSPKKDVLDYNRIPENEIPAEIAGKYLSFKNISLKSVSLIINHPDKQLREAVYNCIDTEKLRAAFFPEAKGFYDIKTVLPLGVPGALPGKPVQTCRRLAWPEGQTPLLTFANWREDNTEPLKMFASDFFKRSGIRIGIEKYDAYELVKTLFRRPHPYNLVMIGTSVVHPEYEVFFKDILGKDGLLDFDLPRESSLYGKMIKTDDLQEKINMAEKIAEGLSEEAVALPLYQEVRNFYYPPEIKNLVIGTSFIEYPEVADFRW